jgi:hypothetical protein
MSRILSEFYRTPDFFRVTCTGEEVKNGAGFFRFGSDIVCYGECSSGSAPGIAASADFDARKATIVNGSEIQLPFEVSNIVDNLRKERYVRDLSSGRRGLTSNPLIRESYYSVRELLPVWFRRHLQMAYFKNWQSIPFPHWPVDFTVDSLHEVFLQLSIKAQSCDKVPFIWFWPDGASSCLILTHDVEIATGRDFVPSLMAIDLSHGFKASFQNVPEKRYEIPVSYVDEIRSRGFEFNVHDLNHDGHLFEEKAEFLLRAKKINEHVKKYGARGFRAGAMYRNQDWFDAFEFSYDMSVPNVAHLEPQRGGCCTVMPYFIGKILELPLTTTQDYSVFQILNTYSIALWKEQIDQIRRRNGLISFNTHPDYLIESRARTAYESLLDHLRETCDRHGIWEALPGEVDRWWRARNEMKLVQDNDGWRIEGPEKDRARIAYAAIDGDRIVYTLGDASLNSPQS